VATRLVLPGALLGTALGILAADGQQLAPALILGIIGLLGGGVMLLGRRSTVGLAALAVALGVAVGTWRGESIALPTGPGSVASLVGHGELQLVATIGEEPKPSGTSQQAILTSVAVSRSGVIGGLVRGRVLARLPRAVALAIGDQVVLTANVEAPEVFDGFDYPAFLARQGIGGIVRPRDVQVVGAQGAGLSVVAAGARSWLLRGLNDVIPEPEAALGAGILLGTRAGIAPEVADAFSRAGLTHVVAISGWNIAIVAALIGGLTRPLETHRGGRWLAALLASSAVAGYVLLTGASPSVVRAALMAGALLIARFGGSRAHAASALAAAALVMLIAAPAVLWDVGFQLSALATAGLIGFAPPLEARLASWPGWLREPMALTLAAQLATLPVLLTTFGRLSVVAPLANVVVVPLVPLVMAACAVAAPIGALDATIHLPIVSNVAIWAAGGSAWLVLRVMILAGQAAAALPFASLPLAAPAWLAAPWYGGLGLAWRRLQRTTDPQPAPEVTPLRPSPPRRSEAWLTLLRRAMAVVMRPWVAGVACSGLLAALMISAQPNGRLHLTALDIGQGDAILVEGPSGETLLIDGGPDPDLVLRRLGEALPWWQRRIDVVLLTHPHQDHVAGLLAVLDRYQVGLVIDPDRPYPNPTYARFLEEARAEPGARLVEARFGQILDLGPGASLRILFPAPADVAAPLPDGDINNASAVGMLRFGGFTALLTGDAKGPIEALLGQRDLLEPIDVLKVGHHGSNASTTLPFLETLHPAAAIISVGTGNPYGHPHRETLDRLAAMPGLRTHRTDLEGSVEVISDGQRFRVVSHRADDGWRAVQARSTGAAVTGRAQNLECCTRCTALAWPWSEHVRFYPRADSAGLHRCENLAFFLRSAANRWTAGAGLAWMDRSRPGAAGSIGPWLFPPAIKPTGSSQRSTFRRGSSSIRVGLRGWRRKRRAFSPRPASRLTLSSSRSPPCCTTSTSPRRGAAASRTGWWAHAG
jgi:competence protein ComEC